jgi:hypothetical protein
MLYGSMGTCLGNIRANNLPGSRKYSYTKNSTKHTPPTISGAKTWGEDQGYVGPPQAVPRMMRPTPKMNRTAPTMSRVARAGSTADEREPFLKTVPSTSSLRRRTKITICDMKAI